MTAPRSAPTSIGSTSKPASRSAAITCCPEERLTSRSAEMPPYSTATRVMPTDLRAGAPGMPMRWISHSRSTRRRGAHAAADFLAETFEIGGGRVAGVDQEVAVLLGDLRAAAHEAAAAGGVDQLPRLHVRRVAEGGAAGARAHRLARLAVGADLRHARGDRGLQSCVGAEAGAHHDAAGGQARRDDRRRRGRRVLSRTISPERRHDLRPVEAARDVAAIGAGVHRHGAADGAGNAGEELDPGEAGGGGVFGDRHVERRGAGDDAVRLHGDRAEAARRAGSPRRASRRRG